MDQSRDTKCKNTKLILDAMELADNMLVMVNNGVPECEDDSCLMIYGIIRDCGYKIRRTVKQELFTDITRIEHIQIMTNENLRS